jgi:hypothetical protein
MLKEDLKKNQKKQIGIKSLQQEKLIKQIA